MKYTKITSYKYRLHEDFTITLPELVSYTFVHPYFTMTNGNLTAQKEYAWNGASGPTIDTDNTLVAGLVHDVLYQAIRAKFIPVNEKDNADRIFFRLLRANGMVWFRAKYFYLGVKWFGKSHLAPKDDGEEMDKIFEV